MTHLFLNADVFVNMLLIPSLCALTKCLRTNRVLDVCPRDDAVCVEADDHRIIHCHQNTPDNQKKNQQFMASTNICGFIYWLLL